MIKYIALLRGINISGKNKIAMRDLKNSFEELSFLNVSTYINSGNVLFSSNISNTNTINNQIKEIIYNKFKLNIPVFVITLDEINDIFLNAPSWWNMENKEIYNNIIFIMQPLTYKDVFKEIGPAKDGYEKISNYKNVIFWSFNLKNYSKTNWIKTASSRINNFVTIRNANTINKLIELSKRER